MKHSFETLRRWWRRFALIRQQPKIIVNTPRTDFSAPADPEQSPIATLLHFDQYATPEELHRMKRSKKFRTRNKYRNRIRRRIRKAEKRRHHHGSK